MQSQAKPSHKSLFLFRPKLGSTSGNCRFQGLYSLLPLPSNGVGIGGSFGVEHARFRFRRLSHFLGSLQVGGIGGLLEVVVILLGLVAILIHYIVVPGSIIKQPDIAIGKAMDFLLLGSGGRHCVGKIFGGEGAIFLLEVFYLVGQSGQLFLQGRRFFLWNDDV